MENKTVIVTGSSSGMKEILSETAAGTILAVAGCTETGRCSADD